MLHGEFARPADQCQNFARGLVVEHRIVQIAASIGCSDRGQHSRAVTPRDRLSRRSDADSQRNKIRIAVAAAISDLDQRQRVVAHPSPVADLRRRNLPRLAAEPALFGQKCRQPLLLQAVPPRPGEHGLPVRRMLEPKRSIPGNLRLLRLQLTLQLQPQEAVLAQRDRIRRLLDLRKLDITQHLHRPKPCVLGEVQLCRLRKPREIGHAQHALIAILPHIRQHLAVRRMQKLERAAAKDAEQLAQRNHVAHPAQQGRRIALLRLDIDRFIAPHRVHHHRS